MNNNENKPKSHPHAELIKAWADGATIQYRPNDEMDWEDCDPKPEWHAFHQYRIKPETEKPWKPKAGELFWVVNAMGEVEPVRWVDGTKFCDYARLFGNCFQTKEEAEAAIPRMERALKNLYAISDKKAHDLECELYDKIDRLTKYPEIDGKPLTDGENALIKAIRSVKIARIPEYRTSVLCLPSEDTDTVQVWCSDTPIAFLTSSLSSISKDKAIVAALKQIKTEQESTK